MIDINLEAQKALLKTGYRIVFQYPQCMAQFPVVSFNTVSESGDMSADNLTISQRGTVEIDIFASTPKECGEMALVIDSVMAEEGWIRVVSGDTNAETDGVFCKTMRFTKSFYIFE